MVFLLKLLKINTGYYPFHIHSDKLIDKTRYTKKYGDIFHKHSLSAITRVIYKEPFAFYLSEEDKKYYKTSDLQTIEFVKKLAITQLHEAVNSNSYP